MIKNIIFDMGNVLLDYNPQDYVKAFLHCEEDQDMVLTALFGGQEWLDLDHGLITERDALKKMLQKLPKRLHQEARALFYGWQNYTRPIEGVNLLAIKLHRAGYRLYLLSNTGVRLHVYAHRLPALQYFDGAVMSADVQQVKPEPQIYQILFDRYHLDPKECFFIDDCEQNLKTGKQFGMHVYLFDGDEKKLESALHKEKVNW